jgi:hypothetical protein
LPDPKGLAGGKFQGILPYNAKAALREDLKSYPTLRSKTTEVWIAYYFQNWIKFQAVFGPVKVRIPFSYETERLSNHYESTAG